MKKKGVDTKKYREVRETDLLAGLPPEYPFDVTQQIHNQIRSTPNEMVVYLEDDSTGVQTSHDIYLVTDFSESGIRTGLKAAKEAGHRLLFILTNSRVLSFENAEELNREIAIALIKIAREEEIELRIGSRSDSTLRGHFPLEPLILKKTLEKNLKIKYDGIIVSHAFLTEMKRITLHGIHYLRIRKNDGSYWYKPVHLTKFAKDKRFGYPTSNMADYIKFKFSTYGLRKITTKDILHIKIEDIREGGPEKVNKMLMTASEGQFITVDIVTHKDMKVFILGLLISESQGKNFIYRSAASFPTARVDMKEIDILNVKDITGQKVLKGNLLLIWGSIVELSNKQLQAVIDQISSLVKIQFDVIKVLSSATAMEKEIIFAKEKVEKSFLQKKHALIYTVPRKEYPEIRISPEARANNQQRIANALQEVLNRLTVLPTLMIFKGGATSSTGLFNLGAKKIYVMGQVSSGIPIVKVLPLDNVRFPGTPIFIILGPGNVGVENTYVDIVRKLTEKRTVSKKAR